MSVQGNEYELIFAFLRSLHFHFLDTWVVECVNYYKSVQPNISFDVLKNEVKQQWLLLNLREIKVPCLPPDLKLKNKITLNGNYAVQVESMIDSSVSYYSQFQKLMKVDLENIETTKKKNEENIKANRCLTFVICDGVQEIQAMEYQPIKKIKTNDPELLPGFKMVISGPVECRKGMILLKDENVRVCGGEVDSLAISNSLKSILIRKLDLDENDFHENASPDFKEENEEIPENKSHETVAVNNIQDDCIESLLSQNDDLFLSLPLEHDILKEKTEPKISLSNITMVEYRNMLSEDINDWNDVEDENLSSSKKHTLSEEEMDTPDKKRLSLDIELKNSPGFCTAQNQSQITMDDYDRDIFNDDFNEPSPEVFITESKPKKTVQTKLSNFFKDSYSNSNTVCRTSGSKEPTYVSGMPFVYFKQVELTKISETCIFTFKAVILTLKKKITIENDEFNLKATFTDGSSTLDFDFCSQILEDFLGFSPCEMKELLKAKQTNSAIAQRVKELFSKAQERLISLNCLMDVKFFPDGRTPVILSLHEVTAQHLQALKDRKLK